jgi:hypothetical protein
MTDAKTMLGEALLADGPRPDLADAMSLYGQFVGSWEGEVVDHDADGSRHASRGEWHFAWALEGRAVQDVFVVPRRAERTAGGPAARNRYGTTLRVLDPATGLWHITWINPVRPVRTTLVGRRVGDEIVQEGRDDDGTWNRWVFSDVRPRAFRWRGEVSTDGGATWKRVAEFVMSRTAPGR